MANIPQPMSAHDPLLATNHDVLEMIATGESLPLAMRALCERVEQISPDAIVSILQVRAGKLHTLAAPSLSKRYCEAIEGASVGPLAGSCGTAAYLGAPVEVHDIATDPRWASYSAMAAEEGLGACWSSPIKSRHGQVVGTFAFYYREKRGPSDLDRTLVERCMHLCAIAIDNDLARSDMHRLAYFDPVTRLMNRGAFQRRLAAAIEEAETTERPLAVYLVDLDEFKQVNDTLGHPVGDQLLAAIANRLLAVVRQDGEVARIGGDEFAILASCSPREAAADLAWRVLGIFATPFVIDEHHIHVDASIGVSIAPDDGNTLPAIMRNADLALYRAKADGKGRYRFFVPMLAEAARSRQRLAQDLKRAVANEEFTVVYQPIVDLRTRHTAGCEALLRWKHPERGLVPPASFLPLAEEMGLINQIGEWVLREACGHAARWPAETTLSVNISPVQLRAPGFLANLKRALSWSGLPSGRLTLEITESAVLSDDATTYATLLQIKEMGVGIALDDFGTGFSSLRSLRIVPLTSLKIDQSFVVELGQAPASTSIIRAVIALARSLGIQTTAEGVETSERAWQLLAEGCDFGQGYFFGRPVDADGIEAHFRSQPEERAVVRSVAGA